MAEEVGSIYYDVDFDTSKLTTGANRVNAALDSAQKGADRTDAAFARAAKSLAGTAKATDEESAALRKLLGQIDPTVAATQRLDSLTKQLGQSFDRGHISAADYEANLKKLDAQYGKLEGSTKQAKITSEGFGAKLTPLAGIIAGLISIQTLKQFGELAEQFTLLQSRINRLSPDLVTASDTYKQLLSIAGQTGQTLPATVKLWETLSTSLKSLGATNAEVLTLTGTLQKIGKIGGSSAEETANALRQLGQALSSGTLRAEEFNSISEQTPELVRQLATASGKSMGEFRQAMLDGKLSSQQLLDLLLQRVPQVDEEFQKLPRSAADAGNAVTVAFGAALSKLDQALGASSALAKALDGLAGSINNISGNLTGVEKLNSLLADQADTARLIAFENDRLFGPNKKRLEQLTTLQQNLNDQIEFQRKTLAQTPTQGKSTRVEPTTSPDGQKEVKRLQDEAAALRVQGLERAQILAVQKLGASATAQEIAQAKQLAAEIYKQKEAEKQAKTDKTKSASEAAKAETARAAAARKAANEEKTGIEQNQKAFTQLGSQLAKVGQTAREAAQDSAQLSLNKYATPEQIQTVRDMAGALYDLKGAKAALAQVDPIASEQQQFEEQMKQLDMLHAAKGAYALDDIRYEELKHQAEVAHAEQMRVLQEENFKAASLGNQLLIDSVNALGQSGTQALSGLLSGTTSLKDAMGGIASTVLNTVIGAFVQMGTDWVKQELIMAAATRAKEAASIGGIAAVAGAQAGATGAIAATTTATAATTGTAVATSMAPAAGLSSIASFGGAAVIGGAALLATMLLAKSFGGGRQYGGGVAANKMYRVNEGGAPEIFNAAGGKQYMMPNTRGEVVSNGDATAGGGGSAAPIININNYTGQGATTKSTFSEADRSWVVDVVVGDGMGGGKVGSMVNTLSGTRRQGT
jgi:tape measure domain-containing protein